MQAYETIDALIVFLWNKMKVCLIFYHICNASNKQALVLIKKNLYKKDTKLTYLISRTSEEIKTWLIKKVNNPSKQCLFQKLEQYCNM
jgi:hypothetical protein